MTEKFKNPSQIGNELDDLKSSFQVMTVKPQNQEIIGIHSTVLTVGFTFCLNSGKWVVCSLSECVDTWDGLEWPWTVVVVASPLVKEWAIAQWISVHQENIGCHG